MGRHEPLWSTWRPIPLHRSFSLSEWQVAVFRAVVEPLVGPMIKARCDLALGGAVGTQLVRDDPFRHEPPAFHQLDQKPLCRALVSP